MRKLLFPIKLVTNLIFLLMLLIISTKLFQLLFQNKHYKLKDDLNEDDIKYIQENWHASVNILRVADDYKEEYINILKYFTKLNSVIVFDAEKDNPQFSNIKYLFNIIGLAQEAIDKLDKVTASNKKLAYYESSKNASLDTLIEHFTKKLTARNEDKVSTKQAKSEIKIKRFIAKLKKHDSLFINFYLMMYTIYPISNLNLKKEDEEYLTLFQDIFEFYSIGHATKQQIYKSVAIQVFKLYEHNISKIHKESTTTGEELKNNISLLIDYTFNTNKHYQNFNNIEEEAYVKNVIYNFPLFECDNVLANKQIKRFKFYFIGKNTIVPKYIPRPFRRYFLNKFLTSPLSFYRTSTFTTLFGLKQKKI